MILYNSFIAKIILNRKRNKREHYFMIFGCCFTRYKYLEIWEDMELRIHERQYFECFLLALIPSLVLSLLFSWWFMLLDYSVIIYFTGPRDVSDIIPRLTGKHWNIAVIPFI